MFLEKTQPAPHAFRYFQFLAPVSRKFCPRSVRHCYYYYYYYHHHHHHHKDHNINVSYLKCLQYININLECFIYLINDCINRVRPVQTSSIWNSPFLKFHCLHYACTKHSNLLTAYHNPVCLWRLKSCTRHCSFNNATMPGGGGWELISWLHSANKRRTVYGFCVMGFQIEIFHLVLRFSWKWFQSRMFRKAQSCSNSAVALAPLSACIARVCSPIKPSLLSMHSTVPPPPPLYGLMAVHTEHYKVMSKIVFL
jgi:hypothetical protein